jgi:hypothetical protein
MDRKIGQNRGTARLWLEGKTLADCGWKRGDKFNVQITDTGLAYMKNAQGTRKVAGTIDRPIIDTNSNKLLQFCEIGDVVDVAIGTNIIVVIQK